MWGGGVLFLGMGVVGDLRRRGVWSYDEYGKGWEEEEECVGGGGKGGVGEEGEGDEEEGLEGYEDGEGELVG